MKKYSTIIEFFTEYANGVQKPSLKRLGAFMLIATSCAISLICVLQDKIKTDNVLSIIALIGSLLVPALTIMGYAYSVQKTDINSTTANPNAALLLGKTTQP